MALSLAITASTEERLLTQTIEAMFGVQAGYAILIPLGVDAEVNGVNAVADALVAFADNTETAASFSASIVANLGITEENSSADAVVEATAFVEAQLNSADEANWGSTVLSITTLFSGLEDDATYGAAATAYNAAVEASLNYSLVPENTEIRDPAVATELRLTTGLDDLLGSIQDDTFKASIVGNTDTAQTGDMIDGGAGNDTLAADFGDYSNFAIKLETTSVENFVITAQDSNNSDNSDNNIQANGLRLDAEQMDGTMHYESNNSRADVIVEDVRILRDNYGDDTNQITRDVTIAMVSTDPGNVDFGVYFDQHSLVAQGDTTTDVLKLSVSNTLRVSDGFDSEKPLNDIPYGILQFSVGGAENTVQITFDATEVDTYDQMWTAIETAFDAEVAKEGSLIAGATIERVINGESFIAKDGEDRFADEYFITVDNQEISPVSPGWGILEGAVLPENNAFAANMNAVDGTVDSSLITSTIILDDVGSGSMGGDLIVGGLSIGNAFNANGTSNSKGVEQFDITVERSSQLQEINSTNNTLEEVYIKNGAIKGDLVVAGDDGALSGYLGNGDNNLDGAQGNAGFTDVRVIDASAMEGKVSIDAELTNAVVAKYMDLEDTQTNPSADDISFMYKLGSNDDVLNLAISKDNLAAAGTTTREDLNLTIAGNAGNDTITTKIGDGSGTDASNWYRNSTDNANLAINSGSGDDTVTTTGAGNVAIVTESGNDTVYTNNDGIQNLGGATTQLPEVQTINFAGLVADAAGGNITVGGVTVAIAANANTAVIGAAVSGALNGVVLTAPATAGAVGAVDNGAGLVTITYAAAEGNVAQATYAANTTALVTALEVPEVQTIDFAGLNADIDGNITVGGLTVAVLNADADTVTAGKVATALNAQLLTAPATGAAVTAVAVGTVVTITYDAADMDVAQATYAAGTSTLGNAVATAEVQTIDFAGVTTTANGNIVVGGVAVTVLDADTDAQIAGKVAAALNAQLLTAPATANAVAAAAVGTVVTITYDPLDGNVSQATAVSGSAPLTGATADATTVPFAAIGSQTATNDATTTPYSAAVVGSTADATTTEGGFATAQTAMATWVVNSTNTEITDLDSQTLSADALLIGAKLTVTLSNAGGTTAGRMTDASAAANVNGFESTVDIGTTGALGNESEINQAIKNAINNDAVLSKLLVATDGPANTLVITSLVDGQFNVADLNVNIAASTLTSSEMGLAKTAMEALANNSGLNPSDAAVNGAISATAAALNGTLATGFSLATLAAQTLTGAESTSVSDNTINLGSGNDVVVLGTDLTSNDTVVFTDNFGHNTVFNFVQTAIAGQDQLDFTSYLDMQQTAVGSTSANSQSDIAITASIDAAGSVATSSNDIVVVNNWTSSAGESWSNMTGTDVLAALESTSNATDAYGNLSSGTISSPTLTGTNTQVGTAQTSILLIENNSNQGEYKVFEVSATNGADYTAVDLIGTVDLGASLTTMSAFTM